MWHLSRCQLYPAPGLAKGFQQGLGRLVGVAQAGVLLAQYAVQQSALWLPDLLSGLLSSFTRPVEEGIGPCNL